MKYAVRDIPTMLATPGGRLQLYAGIRYRLWPLAAPLASWYRRTLIRHTRVVAVVGSFGKTTTTRTVAAALGLPLHDRMMFNAWTSIALALLRIRPAQRHAAIEAGIGGPGEMARYARLLRPDIVVVTSIGSEHAPAVGTLEAIRDEKAWMVRALPRAGVAVLNGDDPRVMWMAGQTQARVVTFGLGPACDVRARDVRLHWPAGTRFRVAAFGAQRDVLVRLVGNHMIYPALAAIAVASVEGLDLDHTLALLSAVPPASGRMEPVALANGAIILRDDFKSTLETVHAALDVFAAIPARRRIVVFGEVSEPPSDAAGTYREIGARVAGMAAHLVIVGHNVRNYAAGARRAGMPRAAVHDGGRDVLQAAEVLRGLLEPGDVVLLKGRRGQMLDRVRLLLEGRRVGCDIGLCFIPRVACEGCPMLESGWGTHRMVTQKGIGVEHAVNSKRIARAAAPSRDA